MESGLIPVQIGWQDSLSTFYVELTCPSLLEGCLSQSIIKYGHDTSVKGHPQHFMCKKCDALYCENCARALINMENACWVCNEPIDESKPVKLLKKEDEKDIKIIDKK